MIRYAVLNVSVLLLIVLCLHLYCKVHISKAVAITVPILLAMTAVFDSLIINMGIVEYNKSHILGVYVWKAPIEDFGYIVASVILVGLLWEYYDKKISK